MNTERTDRSYNLVKKLFYSSLAGAGLGIAGGIDAIVNDTMESGIDNFRAIADLSAMVLGGIAAFASTLSMKVLAQNAADRIYLENFRELIDAHINFWYRTYKR